MIGVLAKPGQAAFVAEFFELFKTPWEFCEEGRAYDVVIATTDEIPEVDARLLVLYGSKIKRSDWRNDITVRWLASRWASELPERHSADLRRVRVIRRMRPRLAVVFSTGWYCGPPSHTGRWRQSRTPRI